MLGLDLKISNPPSPKLFSNPDLWIWIWTSGFGFVLDLSFFKRADLDLKIGLDLD